MRAGQATTLRAVVANRCNILVAGGTSIGKTTLTNALLAEVAKSTGAFLPPGWELPRLFAPCERASITRLFLSTETSVDVNSDIKETCIKLVKCAKMASS
jgi:septin family protein